MYLRHLYRKKQNKRHAHESQGEGIQLVAAKELLLEAFIIVRGKKSREITIMWGEILAANEVKWKGLTRRRGTSLWKVQVIVSVLTSPSWVG